MIAVSGISGKGEIYVRIKLWANYKLFLNFGFFEDYLKYLEEVDTVCLRYNKILL